MIKLITLLKEDLLGKIQKKYEVYKNPKSIKRMKPFLRGISFPSGDLFVVDDAFNTIHNDLEIWLNSNGYKVNVNKKNVDLVNNIKLGYIPWQRKGNSNEFYLSESIDFFHVKYFNKDELMPYLEKYTKKVKQKNSKYNFVLEEI